MSTKSTGTRNSSRGEKLQKTLELLQRGVEQIMDEGSFKKFLRLQTSFHDYSASNVLLILAQNPQARMVKGYAAWKKFDRHVMRGEKGIAILAPVFRKAIDEKEGQDEAAAARILSGFRTVFVYDVTQTTGAPLPLPPLPADAPDAETGEAAETGETGETSEESTAGSAILLPHYRLLGFLRREGVEISVEDLSNTNTYAYYSHRENRIHLHSGLSGVASFTTLIHEAVHYILHSRFYKQNHLVQSGEAAATATTGEDPVLSKAGRETEAEGTAFCVCEALGLDTTSFSFPYVAAFARYPEVLRNSIERIQKAAHLLMEEVCEEEDKVSSQPGGSDNAA